MTGGDFELFDDMPPREDLQNFHHLNLPGHPEALSIFLGKRDTTLVVGNGAVAWNVSRQTGKLFPDLMVAFDVDPAVVWARNGYGIDYVGKPPDFILEIAAPYTPWHDYTFSRERYAEFGVREHWRCDFTGENHFPELLAGDRLVEGEYQPTTVVQTGEAVYRGRSDALKLDLCWRGGEFRWYDPADQCYLLTHREKMEACLAAKAELEVLLAAKADRDARIAAEAQRAVAEAQTGCC